MAAKELFAIGTLLQWAGWVFAFRAVLLAIQFATKAPGLDIPRAQRGLILSAVAAALSFGISRILPMGSSNAGFRLPLVWFAMPFLAWLAVVGVACIVVRLMQAAFAVSPEERLHRLIASGIWTVILIAAVWLYKHDPDNKIEIFTGGIELQFSTFVAIVLLGIAGMIAMVIAARETASRGFAKTVVTQAVLIAGSVIFGVPFAFLLITSFKEDRDMSSPHGIVWVPRVQVMLPYFDKSDPLFEGSYKGQTVSGSVIKRNPDGTAVVDIEHPTVLRGTDFVAPLSSLKEIPKQVPVVTGKVGTTLMKGKVIRDLDDGRQVVSAISPADLAGKEFTFQPSQIQPVRNIGLRLANYPESLEYLPPETDSGLVYLKNTLILVVTSVIGTILSSAIVAYAFSRMRFPGRDALFAVLLSTMMLPGAVTLLPQFLIFRQLGWIDTLYPLWVPAFFASAFNVFLLRQFFMQIPMELEDAAKIDGCTYIKTFWSIMMPLIKPALAVIAIWTFMGAWNNFMGPLIYISSAEHMPLSYGLQLFQGDRSGEPGLLMAFATLCMLPVLLLFFSAQKYFIEGVTLSGLGGR